MLSPGEFPYLKLILVRQSRLKPEASAWPWPQNSPAASYPSKDVELFSNAELFSSPGCHPAFVLPSPQPGYWPRQAAGASPSLSGSMSPILFHGSNSSNPTCTHGGAQASTTHFSIAKAPSTPIHNIIYKLCPSVSEGVHLLQPRVWFSSEHVAALTTLHSRSACQKH